MSTPSTHRAATHERLSLEAAHSGDEHAFAELTERYRGELHAHCYRMLGSVHDAEDALQETMLRAWRGLARFEGRSSLRSWLYTIATNTCLNAIERRPKRVLPIDYGPARDPHVAPGDPLVESVWLEPYPDETLGLEDGYAGPEASYERRESVELAFIAALQHLPPNQRAVLILREVLGFSAKEVAETVDTTVASVNSALQRARAAVDERVGERSQQQTLRSLGDNGIKDLVTRYVDAWEHNDVEAFAAMLTEDATFAMPPLSSWYRGREAIAAWAAAWPMSGAWRWRTCPDDRERPAGTRVLRLERRGPALSPVRAQRADASRRPGQRRDRVHRAVGRRPRPRGVRTLSGRAGRRRQGDGRVRAFRVARGVVAAV